MPLVSLVQAERFAEVCDIELPQKLREGFLDCKSKEEERDFGLSYISDLCDALIENNADGLHFYTLNRADLTGKICSNLTKKRMTQKPYDAFWS